MRLILIATVVLLVVCGAWAIPNCPSNTLVSCHEEFNTELGLSTMANWNDPILFNQELEQIVFTQGISGAFKVCRAFVDFHTCLGPNWYDCTSPEYFAAYHYNMSEIDLWSMTFREYHFSCGAGFQNFINNWDCYVSLFMDPAKNATLQKCFQEYAPGFAYPSEQCGVAKDLLLCLQVEVNRQCNDALAFAFCETIRQGLLIDFYYCDMTCTQEIALASLSPPEKRLENYIRNPAREAKFAGEQPMKHST